MKQTNLKLNLYAKKTRKQEFLEQMKQVVPLAALVERITPYYPESKTGRPTCMTWLRATACSMVKRDMYSEMRDTPMVGEWGGLNDDPESSQKRCQLR